MFSWKSAATAAAVLAGAVSVSAESHTINFVNNCGTGTPVLSQNFNTISNGPSYTANGPFSAAIAYLDTGCGFQGDNCAIVELTLINGGVSSVDVSLIPNHAFNVKTGFTYFNGCDGTGATCASADCPTTDAFHVTDDYEAQRQCTSDDVGVTITFC
ncbi:hypothetical protein CYLTODRAFT_374258 [Cylindrobasidium torrendii FP15055 ss-10]|uniref:Glycopeptide n=1 Tax=Cylindrobasidium torrendii FP15055 ss-10 TaxID=1314674 RepID=A0A0D7BDC9_9AGAR|nr:hypothetical protein CYLTODRAFT_374258 [Cylindrobasidium torrendii FP15055 ss-10]